MKITFRCGCGRKYSVAAELAGKAVRCVRCGEQRRVPVLEGPPVAPGPAAEALTPPGLDLFGLDEAAEAEPVAAEPMPAPRTRAAAKQPVAPGEGRPESWGGWVLGGFIESIPRGEDWRYPAAGVAALVVTLVVAVVGGFVAKAFFLFVPLAALAVMLRAGFGGLAAAWRQGAGSALVLVPGLVATLVFYGVLVAPGLTAGRFLAAGGAAAACFAAFFFVRKRGARYRRPIAQGMLATLLVASSAIMWTIARSNMARRAGAEPASLAGPALPTPKPARPGKVAAPVDTVGKALREDGTLAEARGGFRPGPFRAGSARDPLETPPPGVFATVRYDSPAGRLAAYLTPDPGDGRKHPAIVWITGGDCNSIGDVWSPRPPSNDQTAAAYRKAGIVLMFPSLRGAHDNPGQKEGFLGEVDDVLAAADFLAKQSWVDPGRIYLGGHSTGGTLALLAAESTDRFRAVFSFGPVDDVRGYGPDGASFDTNDVREVAVRSPGYWLHSVRSPTFVIEGVGGNIEVFRAMRAKSTNPLLHFFEVPGTDHFAVLGPTNRLIAARILRDVGPTANLAFTPEEIAGAFRP